MSKSHMALLSVAVGTILQLPGMVFGNPPTGQTFVTAESVGLTPRALAVSTASTEQFSQPGGDEGSGQNANESNQSNSPGIVYTLSNQVSGNRVLVFKRAGNGSLTPSGSYPTGGFGTGGGLGNQGAVILSSDHQKLFAVNAGSNELSVFEVDGRKLILTDIVPSGGERPVSVTHHEGRVYVLNAMGAGNISGFSLSQDGRLTPIANSTKPLSGAAATGSAQVQFCPFGDRLVVTEKATSLIDSYLVGPDGVANGPIVNVSHGMTPFGFDFTANGTLIVSEAFGGAANASALSSYDLAGNGMLGLISGTVPTTETAACWVVTTRNGRFAYTSNTGSGTISGYSVHQQTGALTLLNADGITAGTGSGSCPIDLALSRQSRYLYALNSSTHEIIGFRVNMNDGSLTLIGTQGGLPVGANGLAAR